MIFFHEKKQAFQTRNIEFNLTFKVGGMFGVGKSESSTDFVFEKEEFYAGEEARVRIVCDNSRCSKAIKSFKFKVYRHIAGKTGNKKYSIDSEGYV